MEAITIDAALGGIYDTIGGMLENEGLEDASGARRFYLDLLIKEDYEPFCRDLNLSLAGAKVLRMTYFGE